MKHRAHSKVNTNGENGRKKNGNWYIIKDSP